MINPYQSPVNCEEPAQENILLCVLKDILFFWTWDWIAIPVVAIVVIAGPFTCLLWVKVWERYSPSWLLLSLVLTPVWWLLLFYGFDYFDRAAHEAADLLNHYFPRTI